VIRRRYDAGVSPAGIRRGVGARQVAYEDEFEEARRAGVLSVDEADAVEAEARRMAEELLANTVIEGFDVRIPSEP